jgi:hypothetical protein
MRPPLKARPGYKPIKIVKAPSIAHIVPVKPRRAVSMPSVHNKTVPIIRTTKPVASRQVKKVPRAKGVSVNKLPSVVKPTVRKRTLSSVRPSHLRRAQDKILSKHIDKIRGLRGCGHGRILIILACGPSINQIDNLEGLTRHPKIDIMCINKPEPRAWPSTYWIFCDQSQYNRNQDHWASYKGTIINAASVRATHPNQILIRTIAGKGFSRDISKGFHIGRSTTYTAMQVALYMGYDRIYVLGCDMGEVDGQMHRYGQNPDVSNENRKKRFDKEAEHFMWGTKSLKDHEKQKFVICSSYNTYDFADHYDRLDQREAVDAILEAADGLMTKKEFELAKIQ